MPHTLNDTIWVRDEPFGISMAGKFLRGQLTPKSAKFSRFYWEWKKIHEYGYIVEISGKISFIP
jgi:hypothetical protein